MSEVSILFPHFVLGVTMSLIGATRGSVSTGLSMGRASLLFVREGNVGISGAGTALNPSDALMIVIAAKMKTLSD